MLKGQYFTGGLWTKLYRKSLFEGIQFDATVKTNEDILVNVQVLKVANQIVFIDLTKYRYFERELSACNITHDLRKLQDGIAVAEKILRLHAFDELTPLCTENLQRKLLSMYRYYLINDYCGSSMIRKDIHNQWEKLTHKNRNSSRRLELMYYVMLKFPRLYRLVYLLYDRIRTPNWDAKK